MRSTWLIAMAALVAAAPVVGAVVTAAPDPVASFSKAVPDVCFQIARGNRPTSETAGAMRLEPAADVPVSVKDHFVQLTSWYRLKSDPANIFVGLGEKANACHVVLANTTRTDEMQKALVAFLRSNGFELLQASPRSSPFNDMLFVREVPDGYMQVALQAPRSAIRDGDGDQGAVQVSLIRKAVFEAMVARP